MSISNLSSISPKAKIGSNVTIGPFTTIGDDVTIGDNCSIASHVSIMDGVKLGDNCNIFPGAILGAITQDLKYKEIDSFLEIGNNVVIREYCTLNKGTDNNQKTIIQDNCLLMAYVHIAHDCKVSNNCIIANNAALAGHIELEPFVRIGGMVAIHQFVKIGKFAFIGGGSLVRKDVPPYIKAAREPLSYVGVNSIGLERSNFPKETIHHIQDIYRLLYVKGLNISQACKIIKVEIPNSEYKEHILSFIENSSRGLIRGFRQS